MARGQSAQTGTGGGLAPWQADLALRRMARDITAEVSAGELADLCGLSRSHFAKAFKVSMGTPPHRWLVRQRIRCAAVLLEQTRASVAEIALRCGFADQSHLTRVFHAMVGASPAAWRRQRRAGVAPRIESPSLPVLFGPPAAHQERALAGYLPAPVAASRITRATAAGWDS